MKFLCSFAMGMPLALEKLQKASKYCDAYFRNIIIIALRSLHFSPCFSLREIFTSGLTRLGNTTNRH